MFLSTVVLLVILIRAIFIEIDRVNIQFIGSDHTTPIRFCLNKERNVIQRLINAFFKQRTEIEKKQGAVCNPALRLLPRRKGRACLP